MKRSPQDTGLLPSLETELNYYEVLLIPNDAPQPEVKRAYEKLEALYTLDSTKGEALASQRLDLIRTAYAVLSDPARRQQYNRGLAQLSTKSSRTAERSSRSQEKSRHASGRGTTLDEEDIETEDLGSKRPFISKTMWAAVAVVGVSAVLGVALWNNSGDDPQREMERLRQKFPAQTTKTVSPQKRESSQAFDEWVAQAPKTPREAEGGQGEGDAASSRLMKLDGPVPQDTSSAEANTQSSMQAGGLLKDVPLTADSSVDSGRKVDKPDATNLLMSKPLDPKAKMSEEQTKTSLDVSKTDPQPKPGDSKGTGQPSRDLRPAAPQAEGSSRRNTVREAPEASPPAPDHALPSTSPAEEREVSADPSPLSTGAGKSEKMEDRLLGFLNRFLGAVEKKDLKAVAKFFGGRATEDGKSWNDLAASYQARFENAGRIKYEVEVTQWRTDSDKTVTVDGDFKLRFENKDEGVEESSGRLKFVLQDSGNELRLVSLAKEVKQSKKLSRKDVQAQALFKFFNSYIAAYQGRNLEKVMNFFDAAATENGQSMSATKADYKSSFQNFKKLAYDIHVEKWEPTSEGVVVMGRFRLKTTAKDNTTQLVGGPIRFLLSGLEGDVKIKKLDYNVEQTQDSPGGAGSAKE